MGIIMWEGKPKTPRLVLASKVEKLLEAERSARVRLQDTTPANLMKRHAAFQKAVARLDAYLAKGEK